ncbi:MAG: hypothetical protein A2236_09800, partial [Bacteroidetes bacterium RIFOXYA2_FULL_33_7]
MKRLFLSILSVTVFGTAFAQQIPQFSLRSLDMLYFNPGISGSTSLPEIKLHHRNQWVGFGGGSPMTSSLSYHFAMNQRTGIGTYIFNDKSGPTGKMGLNLSYAHHLPVKTFWLSLGLSASVVQHSLNGSDFDLKDGYDPKVSEGMNDKSIKPDFNFGALAYNQKFFLGFSVLQMLNFNVKFDSSNEPANMQLANHFYVVGGYTLEAQKGVEIEPSFLVQIINGAPTMIDLNVKAAFNHNIIAGISYRYDDSALLMAGYRFDRYFIAYSYDIVLS